MASSQWWGFRNRQRIKYVSTYNDIWLILKLRQIGSFSIVIGIDSLTVKDLNSTIKRLPKLGAVWISVLVIDVRMGRTPTQAPKLMKVLPLGIQFLFLLLE